MNIDKSIPAAVAVLAILALAFWLGGSPVTGLQARLPEADAPKTTSAQVYKPVAETARTEMFDVIPLPLPGAWPRFRGPDGTGLAEPQPPLARTWPKSGPPQLWSIPVGEGHAGAAILDGRVYLLDYDAAAHRDTLRCLSLETGRDVWRFSYPVEVLRQYGMSRTVPAVTADAVVSLGPKCHLTCVDTQTGKLRWAYDLVHDFGAAVPQWYNGQCPLIDHDRAIIALGAPDALLAAFDLNTGAIAWKAPNPHNWKMTHTSVVPLDFNGRRVYLYSASAGLAGVSADDGRILFETDAWRVTFANIPSPIPLGGGRVFLTGGYGAGSAILQLTKRDGRIVPEIVARIDPRTFSGEQHTPISYQGHLYGVSDDGQLKCLDTAGRLVWSSGRTARFGRGGFLIADGLIYIMNDGTGELTLAEATPAGYRELARSRVLPGPEAYGPPALAAGRLIVRNLNTMTCLDVRSK